MPLVAALVVMAVTLLEPATFRQKCPKPNGRKRKGKGKQKEKRRLKVGVYALFGGGGGGAKLCKRVHVGNPASRVFVCPRWEANPTDGSFDKNKCRSHNCWIVSGSVSFPRHEKTRKRMSPGYVLCRRDADRRIRGLWLATFPCRRFV